MVTLRRRTRMNKRRSEASDTFVSLFTICLSGTHATVEQRLGVIEGLLNLAKLRPALGLAALDEVLETTDFSASYQFEFGARSRDYGYQPRSQPEVARWYGAALALIKRLALTEGVLKPELRNLLAKNFAWPVELGTHSRRTRKDIPQVRRRWVLARGLGRVPADDALRKGSAYPGGPSRLCALEADLRPSNLRKGTCGGPG